jgi:hypothetical protein
MSVGDRSAIARFVVIALLGVGSAAAQSTSATLTGVVLDEHRAVMAETAITLTNLDTGAMRRATSDQAGTFRVAGLIPGRYELRRGRTASSATCSCAWRRTCVCAARST